MITVVYATVSTWTDPASSDYTRVSKRKPGGEMVSRLITEVYAIVRSERVRDYASDYTRVSDRNQP